MSDFEITADGQRVAITLAKLTKELDAELAKIVLRAAQHAQGIMRKQIMQRLAKRPTGGLAGSVEAFLVESGGKIAGAAAAPNKIYARIQDEGGTISSKGKLLAIPVSSKVPLGKSPSDYGAGELRLIPGKNLPGGNSILVAASGKRGKVEPLFVLKREVKIPGVGYVAATAEEAAPGIEEIVAAGVAGALEK